MTSVCKTGDGARLDKILGKVSSNFVHLRKNLAGVYDHETGGRVKVFNFS